MSSARASFSSRIRNTNHSLFEPILWSSGNISTHANTHFSDERYYVDDPESWIEANKELLIAEGAKVFPAKVYLVELEQARAKRRRLR